MRIIELAALPNGAHNNQWSGTPLVSVPDGWALIPEGMEIPETFPFVALEAEESDGVPVVTSMTAGVMPDPEPQPEPEPSAQEDTDALLVEHEYRLTLLELGLTE